MPYPLESLPATDRDRDVWILDFDKQPKVDAKARPSPFRIRVSGRYPLSGSRFYQIDLSILLLLVPCVGNSIPSYYGPVVVLVARN